MNVDDRVHVVADHAPSCRTGTIVEVYPDDKGYLVRHDEPGFTEGFFAGKREFSWSKTEVVPFRPTIYLSNWSSHATEGHHGPGRKYTIMAMARSWELGEGGVTALLPRRDDLRDVKNGQLSMADYRTRFEAQVARQLDAGHLVPGELVAGRPQYGPRLVEDGDTLCCACSRAAAADNECHRVWAAAALRRAGWRVVLDGAHLPESA